MLDKGEIRYKGVAPEDSALDAKLEAETAEFEREYEETRVNFRWGREQLGVVKRAAARMGVPYQTYLKQVVYRQAIADLREIDQTTAGKSS